MVLAQKWILIVHDDPETADSIKKVLKIGEFGSVVVHSRADAQKELEGAGWHRYCGCVIDIGLLDGASEGWHLACWIRERESQPDLETNPRKCLIGVTAHKARDRFFTPEIFDGGLQTPYAGAKLLEAFLKYMDG